MGEDQRGIRRADRITWPRRDLSRVVKSADHRVPAFDMHLQILMPIRYSVQRPQTFPPKANNILRNLPSRWRQELTENALVSGYLLPANIALRGIHACQ